MKLYKGMRLDQTRERQEAAGCHFTTSEYVARRFSTVSVVEVERVFNRVLKTDHPYALVPQAVWEAFCNVKRACWTDGFAQWLPVDTIAAQVARAQGYDAIQYRFFMDTVVDLTHTLTLEDK